MIGCFKKKLPSTQKVLSLSDGSAAYIVGAVVVRSMASLDGEAARDCRSISGAKGKKLTTPEDWESEAYRRHAAIAPQWSR